MFSVIYIEGETQKHYLKRFNIEKETKLNTRFSFIGDNPNARYLTHNSDILPRLMLSYKVSDAGNSFPDDEINVSEFIGVKSYKAKVKLLSQREIDTYQFIEPYQVEEPEPEPVPEPEPENEQDTTEVPDDDDDKNKGIEGVQTELIF